jgi:hypothetical protein
MTIDADSTIVEVYGITSRVPPTATPTPSATTPLLPPPRRHR